MSGDSDGKCAALPWFPRAAQQSGRGAGKQKHDEADPPNAGDRSDLNHRQTIHLRVGEIAECAVR